MIVIVSIGKIGQDIEEKKNTSGVGLFGSEKEVWRRNERGRELFLVF